jgi:hypothetical protein
MFKTSPPKAHQSMPELLTSRASSGESGSTSILHGRLWPNARKASLSFEDNDTSVINLDSYLNLLSSIIKEPETVKQPFMMHIFGMLSYQQKAFLILLLSKINNDIFNEPPLKINIFLRNFQSKYEINLKKPIKSQDKIEKKPVRKFSSAPALGESKENEVKLANLCVLFFNTIVESFDAEKNNVALCEEIVTCLWDVLLQSTNLSENSMVSCFILGKDLAWFEKLKMNEQEKLVSKLISTKNITYLLALASTDYFYKENDLLKLILNSDMSVSFLEGIFENKNQAATEKFLNYHRSENSLLLELLFAKISDGTNLKSLFVFAKFRAILHGYRPIEKMRLLRACLESERYDMLALLLHVHAESNVIVLEDIGEMSKSSIESLQDDADSLCANSLASCSVLNEDQSYANKFKTMSLLGENIEKRVLGAIQYKFMSHANVERLRSLPQGDSVERKFLKLRKKYLAVINREQSINIKRMELTILREQNKLEWMSIHQQLVEKLVEKILELYKNKKIAEKDINQFADAFGHFAFAPLAAQDGSMDPKKYAIKELPEQLKKYCDKKFITEFLEQYYISMQNLYEKDKAYCAELGILNEVDSKSARKKSGYSNKIDGYVELNIFLNKFEAALGGNSLSDIMINTSVPLIKSVFYEKYGIEDLPESAETHQPLTSRFMTSFIDKTPITNQNVLYLRDNMVSLLIEDAGNLAMLIKNNSRDAAETISGWLDKWLHVAEYLPECTMAPHGSVFDAGCSSAMSTAFTGGI